MLTPESFLHSVLDIMSSTETGDASLVPHPDCRGKPCEHSNILLGAGCSSKLDSATLCGRHAANSSRENIDNRQLQGMMVFRHAFGGQSTASFRQSWDNHYTN